MSYKILIAEDDVFISEHLKQILLHHNYDVCGIVSGCEQAVSFLETNPNPDLVLLDIQMHGKDQGIEIAEHLNKLGIPFIYITSFSDKKTVQKAVYQVPKGYILKPYTEEEILHIVQKVLDEVAKQFLIVKEKTSIIKIKTSDILFIKSDNIYIEIYTEKKVYVHRMKLSDVHLKLPSQEFIRVHRSYIVNKSHISKKASLKLEIAGEKIPISRTYKEELRKLF